MTTRFSLTGDRARDQRNVDLLLGALEELYVGRSIEEVERHAVDRAIQVTGANRGVLLLADDEPAANGLAGLRVRVARDKSGKDLPADLRYSRSVTQRVWKTKKPFLTVDAETGNVQPGMSIHELRLLSIMAAPLTVHDRATGVLYVDSTAVVKEFTESDRAVFEALAGMVGIAHEEARLAEKEAEQKRMAAEMAVARSIQIQLMPHDPKAPQGWDLATEGRACSETSGDYHDVIPLEDGTLALVVGDVSGHGLGPALFMACVRALLRMLLQTSKDPVAAIHALNVFLCRDMPEGTFMSLFVGVLDPIGAAIWWVNAGHPAPLLGRSGDPGLPVEELARTGTVLGVVADASYALEGPLPMRPGDTLVLYTDGLTEAHGPNDLWGEDNLHASFRSRLAAGSSSRGVLDGILADVDAFASGIPAKDDVTCLVVRRDPHS